jgi:hypothetical protein
MSDEQVTYYPRINKKVNNHRIINNLNIIFLTLIYNPMKHVEGNHEIVTLSGYT